MAHRFKTENECFRCHKKLGEFHLVWCFAHNYMPRQLLAALDKVKPYYAQVVLVPKEVPICLDCKRQQVKG
ncbi:MAG: hypothetical protein EHM12_10895 [Dehalococcoidia bacterium]|nr:MAG: hypothetical protein EHM12_10895 [Dehalococcoidia bacterium]